MRCERRGRHRAVRAKRAGEFKSVCGAASRLVVRISSRRPAAGSRSRRPTGSESRTASSSSTGPSPNHSPPVSRRNPYPGRALNGSLPPPGHANPSGQDENHRHCGHPGNRAPVAGVTRGSVGARDVQHRLAVLGLDRVQRPAQRRPGAGAAPSKSVNTALDLTGLLGQGPALGLRADRVKAPRIASRLAGQSSPRVKLSPNASRTLSHPGTLIARAGGW